MNTLTFFQNVLRELEQKKPQLDDLVKTAENLRESPIRQQIPEKGKFIQKEKLYFVSSEFVSHMDPTSLTEILVKIPT